MAGERLSFILRGMAAKENLHSSHYKIYLCLFSAIQEGKKHNRNSISAITGMSIRSIRRATKELLKSGNIIEDKEGFLAITFDSGMPKSADIVVRLGDKTTPKNEKTTTYVRSNDCASSATQSMNLREDLRSKIEELCYIEHKTYKEILVTLNKRNILSTSSSKRKIRKSDPRFKKLVEALFVTYEKEVKERLHSMWDSSDAAMLKKLLKALPDEKVERLQKSFENFLWTKNKFDASQIRKKPVRYWTTVVTQYFPSKNNFDVVESYRKKYGKVKKEKNV